MKRNLNRLIVTALLLAGALPARAGGSAGAEPLNFLFLDANARPVALGGAYTALGTDANSLLYNPAGLAWVNRHEATFMHNQYIAGITQEYAAYASPLGFGLNINYMNSGAVARTTISNPDGSGLPYTGLTDVAIAGGYARQIYGGLALGGAFKFASESIAGIPAQAYLFDAGARYAPPALDGFSTGLSIQNAPLSSRIKFQVATEKAPVNVRWGAAYSFSAGGYRNALTFDVSKERNESVLVGAGAETLIAQTLALRLGFNNRNTVGTGITGGVGWIYKDLSIDFAIETYGALGFSHRISATMRWGGEKRRPEPAARNTGAANAAPARQAPKADTSAEAAAGHFQAAEKLITQKLFDQAKEELKLAAKGLGPGDPRRALFFARMGYVFWLQNDVTQAKGFFERSVAEASALGLADASVADAYARLGLCHLAEKNRPEAIAAFQKGLASHPSEETRSFLTQQLDKLNGR